MIDETNGIPAVAVDVRADDLDTNGHVRGAAYLAYADHARWVLLGAAGVDLSELSARRLGPVNLETTVRFHAELRPGGRVEVSTGFEYGVSAGGKVNRVRQQLRDQDGVLVAEVSSLAGLLDLTTRRLLPHPQRYWRELATRPDLLGVPGAAFPGGAEKRDTPP